VSLDEEKLGAFTYTGPPEMRRAFDNLVAERNGWRAENDRHRALYVDAAKERDQLRAGIMTAETHGELIVRMRESVWREHEDERDRLRQTVQVQTDAADAAAEAVGAMAEKLSATLVENRRLGAVVGVVQMMWDNVVGTADDAIMGFPVSDYVAIEAALDQLDSPAQRILVDFARDLVADNDRLRAAMSAYVAVIEDRGEDIGRMVDENNVTGVRERGAELARAFADLKVALGQNLETPNG
jgi:hypothetical protein